MFHHDEQGCIHVWTSSHLPWSMVSNRGSVSCAPSRKLCKLYGILHQVSMRLHIWPCVRVVIYSIKLTNACNRCSFCVGFSHFQGKLWMLLFFSSPPWGTIECVCTFFCMSRCTGINWSCHDLQSWQYVGSMSFCLYVTRTLSALWLILFSFYFLCFIFYGGRGTEFF